MKRIAFRIFLFVSESCIDDSFDDNYERTYTYDNVGNLVETKYSNGVTTSYEYNEVNLLTKQVSVNSSGTVLASYEYTLGLNGERLSCRELNRTVSFTYDELNRLTSETIETNELTSVTSYEYDSNSNRISMDRDGILTTYAYNELNQLVQAGTIVYTYDDAGNLVAQSDNGVLVATYEYNSRNQMIRAQVFAVTGNLEETYTYNYLGDRTSKTSNGLTTYYTLDYSTGLSQNLVIETNNETTFYVRGFELISGSSESDTFFYLYDGGNSVRALTDESGNLTDNYIFDAFGNKISHTGESDNTYGFQGEQQDETGLYYLRARYMNPETGTFTSLDTYGGNIADPMSLHKYLFANSNPVTYRDPSGYSSVIEIEVTLSIDTMLDAALYSGLYYCIETAVTDPHSENHSLAGCILTMLTTVAVIGLIAVTVTSLSIYMLLGVLGIGFGAVRVMTGVQDLIDGDIKSGLFKIVTGILAIVLSVRSLMGLIRTVKAQIASEQEKILDGDCDWDDDWDYDLDNNDDGTNQNSNRNHRTKNGRNGDLNNNNVKYGGDGAYVGKNPTKSVAELLSNKELDNANAYRAVYNSPLKGEQAALDEFYSLGPSNVTTKANGTIVGVLSDGSTINYHYSTKTSGNPPTIEIQDTNGYYTKIRY